MENEYIKEIERLKGALDDKDKIICDLTEQCQKWTRNYIVERDNAEALQKVIDDHNQEMIDLCINGDSCDPVYYGPHRGKRECPDCPRMWRIEPPSDKNPGIDE